MRRSLLRLLAPVLLVGALGCLDEPDPFRFNIHGTVRSAADSTPVSGALVRLTAPTSIVEPNELLGETTTDANGNYALSAPLPRGYDILVPGGDCSIVALFVTKDGFGVGPDAGGADVQCINTRQQVDVLLPVE